MAAQSALSRGILPRRSQNPLEKKKKKDENISIEKKYSQNSLESKYEKEILNKMQKVPFSQIKGFFDDDLNHAL